MRFVYYPTCSGKTGLIIYFTCLIIFASLFQLCNKAKNLSYIVAMRVMKRFCSLMLAWLKGGAAPMNSTVREARYIYADVAGNNNKFWNIEELSDSSCSLRWGRVGSSGQTQ